MRPSITRAQQGRSIVSKIVLALAVAAVMVGGSTGPAFSKDNNQRHGHQERNRHEYHGAHRVYQPYYPAYQPYRYYAPPPVIYAPTPSPGISLFFDVPIGHR